MIISQNNKKKMINRVMFPAGRKIVEQGDEGFSAYYLEKGRVEVKIHDGPHELKVSEIGPGEIFGEMALISDTPRTATITAIDDVTASVISRENIEGKINLIEDKAIKALFKVLVERLRKTTHDQLKQYVSLADFQDRISGVVDSVDLGINEQKREDFRNEVEPLLDKLQYVLEKYNKK